MINQPEIRIQTHSNEQLPQQPKPQQEIQKEPVQSQNVVSIDILYDIHIIKPNDQSDITTHSEHYKIDVANRKTNKQWRIMRNYQDFVQLFNALKMALPGYILPYFSRSKVTKFLQQKLIYLNNKERSMYLVSELYQLQNFVTNLSRDQIFGFSEQLRIFLLEKKEDYANSKRKMQGLIELTSMTCNFQIILEDRGFRLSSLIDKGLHLFTNKKVLENIEYSKEWLEIKGKVSIYSAQLYSLVEKISIFKRKKEDEVLWKGPVTEIDSIQKVITKIQSSKPSTEILCAELQVKLLHPLITECKKQVQLQELIQQKDDLQKFIKYLIQNKEDEVRINKLIHRRQKFQTHFSEGWQKASKEWSQLAKELSNRFQIIYQIYSKNMYKIWK